MTRSLRIVALVSLRYAPVCGAVSVPPIFADHMVVERGMEVPVWGKANAGERVTVELLGKKAAAVADEKGDWSLKLPAMSGGGDAASMTISSNADETAKPLVIHDVLVGDVWICSGQSNMGFLVKQGKD